MSHVTDQARVGTRASRVWGEGFAADGLGDLVAVSSASEIECDELVRFYPGIVANGGGADPVIVRHLSSCVDGYRDRRAAAAWEMAKLARFDDLFGPSRPEARRSGPNARAQAGLAFLDAVADRTRARLASGDDPERMIAFSYLTCIHAAYFWRDAPALHEVMTTAGWLGFLAAGRPALRPAEVAD